ncbi:hypothetical protein BM613_05070 [Sulfoacidibacillus thermotolerans]|uniref:Transglycosylase SLT domain-containing protein n=2 Tax=Sulfoacidibacillus thermotolerans TaxID=1765684 RepID=A0A2U3DA21_SULT2|nr:hypothetical protein BM613_05070 [Sulfoacidibacillus thermotolerans]
MRTLVAAALLVGVVSITFIPSFWNLVYPIYYYPVIQREAQVAQVDPFLIAALVRVESHFREDDISHAGAIGLMQLMPDTASWAAQKIGMKKYTRADLALPSINIRLGSWYMAYLLRMFHGNLPEALAAYNAGPNRVRRWLRKGVWSGEEMTINDIPVRETRHFVARVLYTYETFSRFYRK